MYKKDTQPRKFCMEKEIERVKKKRIQSLALVSGWIGKIALLGTKTRILGGQAKLQMK